ncbi:MAG: lysylphosphatidylglycerol synthase transmembrane domain-containing protein [Pseudomonadota bacterium]
MKKVINTARPFFLIFGVVILFFLIRRIGIDSILNNIAALSWRFIPILSIGFVWYILYTLAWEQFLKRFTNNMGFWELFRIKIAGESVNTLTPANFLGGDPLRIHLLKKHFPTIEGAASVVVDRTLHSIAILLVIIFGIIVSFVSFEGLPVNIKYGVPIVVLIASAFVTFIFIHQQKGLFALFMSICKRLRIKKTFSERIINRFEELDHHIINFYRKSHKAFWIALGCHTVGRFLGVIEIYAIGRCVSDEFTLFAALVLCALAPMINAVFAFVPGALGILEGAYSGTLYLLHLDPAIGITIQITKRLRAGLWILLGLIFLGTHGRKKAWNEKLIEEV